jgi:hypothetical protein
MTIIWFWIILILISLTLLQSYLATKKANTYRAENILYPLYKNPSDSEYARIIPSLLIEGKSYHKYDYAQIYNNALELLESNSYHTHLKTLCLNLGRLHYGNLRGDQKPTIHDEKAIQNDIQMRLR